MTATISTESLVADGTDATMSAFEHAVLKEYEQLQVREGARLLKADVEFKRSFKAPTVYPTGADALAVDRPPLQYGIDQIAIRGGNVLLTAAYKTGKTDVCLNVMRAYADEVPFLDRFDVLPMDPGRKVVMLDFELDEDYSWQLYHQQDITARGQQRSTMLHFRGRALDIAARGGREWLTETLIDLKCQILIVDPFGAAYRGEENSNSEVRAWLRNLDEIKAEVGVREMYLTTHTGRAEQAVGRERSRGATVLNDWPDSNITYTAGDDPTSTLRYLRAKGRGVDLAEVVIDWNAADHHLHLLSDRGRAQQRRDDELADFIDAVISHPGSTRNEARAVLGINNNRLHALCDTAEGLGLIEIRKGRSNRKEIYATAIAQTMLHVDHDHHRGDDDDDD